MNKNEGQGVVQRLRLDLLEGQCDHVERRIDADIWRVESLRRPDQGGNNDWEVAVVEQGICQQLVRRLVLLTAVLKEFVDEVNVILQVLNRILQLLVVNAFLCLG